MSTIFLDCIDEVVALWRAVQRPGDPAIAVHMSPVATTEVPGLLAGYDTCINDHTYFDDALLAQCTGLRRIVFLGTGASSFIDLAAAKRRGIDVHTIHGHADTTVAEHTIALAMAAARDIARMDRETRAGGWRQVEGLQLRGKTLGIIGLGGIGREIARIAAGIGLNVIAWNRSSITNPVAPVLPLDEVLATSDLLCVMLAMNDGTRGFMDAEKLRRTKPGVIVINTSRADIVDNHALVALLKSGHVRHAAIDVFSQEPPNPADPLLTAPNVTLTPHSAYMTPEATSTMLRSAIDLVIQHDR